MNKAIIIHGTCSKKEYFNENYPSLSNSHWLPWLQKQLLIQGFEAHTPEIPKAYKPNYEPWKRCLERYSIDSDTTLVGHSCGAGFLLRWLSENKKEISKLILVAPWLDPEREKTTDFFNFRIDPKISKRTKDIHILIAENDSTDIHDSLKQINQSLPSAKIHEFKSKGHFTYNDMNSKKSPELLKLILDQ